MTIHRTEAERNDIDARFANLSTFWPKSSEPGYGMVTAFINLLSLARDVLEERDELERRLAAAERDTVTAAKLKYEECERLEAELAEAYEGMTKAAAARDAAIFEREALVQVNQIAINDHRIAVNARDAARRERDEAQKEAAALREQLTVSRRIFPPAASTGFWPFSAVAKDFPPPQNQLPGYHLALEKRVATIEGKLRGLAA